MSEDTSASSASTAPSPSPAAPSSEDSGNGAAPAEDPHKTQPVTMGEEPSPEGEEAPGAEAARTEYKRLTGLAKRQRAARQREGELRALEQQLAQREVAIKDFERVKQDPAQFFEYASKQGVPLDKAMDHWLASQDPQKKAELDARQAKESEANRLKSLEEQLAAQKQFAVQQQRAVIESDFLSKFRDESKFEASTVLYTPRERIQKGDEIADLASKRGLRVDFDTIAEAVEILAKQDARWTRLQSRFAPKPPPATDDISPPATRAKTLNHRAASEAARPSDNTFADLPLKERVRAARLKGPVPR